MKQQQPEIPLLAKKRKFDEDGKLKQGCLLVEHTHDVVAATKTIIQALNHDLQRFFKLTEEQMPCLIATTALAAFCHDIGKANDGFQDMIIKKRKDQAIRHEHLSTLLMSLPEMRKWLEEFPSADYELARVIVLGHHLKAVDDDDKALLKRQIPSFARRQNDYDKTFFVYSEYQQFKDLLSSLCGIAGSLGQPNFTIPERWSFSNEASGEYIEPHREQIINELEDLADKLLNDEPKSRLLWAAKTVFFAADAVASGLRRREAERDQDERVEAPTIDEWIEAHLLKGKSSEDIEKMLDKRKAEAIRRERAKGKDISEFIENDFQKEMWKLGEKALLRAPCGSGKTIAAYLWIKEQLKTRPGWKVVFLYPTTGTATQGFKDYASHDEDSTVVHSRALFDLKGMFENPDDARSKNDYTTDQRLYALGYWPDAIFSATADAFLSFLQNNYSSLCLLPVLARSVIVIDEIHSFDYAMFAALLEFLQKFHAPVLLMTASLPEQRRERIERACRGIKVYPQKDDMKHLQELDASAKFDRYCVNYKRDWKGSDEIPYPSDLLGIAIEAHDQGFKVLWVVNTVNRCIQIAQKLRGRHTYCYHSRFEYEHRKIRHNDTVNAFQPTEKRGVIAVTTQVCEMSLDLDADILITELAPATSLIQRMGRCNRSIEGREPEVHGRVYIYNPVNANPYSEEEFDSGRDLLNALDFTRVVKQSDLAEKLEALNFAKERNKRCLFTMSDWKAYSGYDFRETDEYAVSAVRESQLDKFKQCEQARDGSAIGFILQAPREYCEPERRPGMWLAVVPDVTEEHRLEYCEVYGLREKSK